MQVGQGIEPHPLTDSYTVKQLHCEALGIRTLQWPSFRQRVLHLLTRTIDLPRVEIQWGLRFL